MFFKLVPGGFSDLYKLKKNIGFRNLQEKLENASCLQKLDTVAQFFHIFVIVLLLEYKKRATAIDRASPLNSSAFNSFLSLLSDETVMFR